MSRLVTTIVTVLAISGCTAEKPAPVTPTQSAAPVVTQTEAAPPYKPGVLDLCTATDVAPLAELSLKVKKTDRTPPFLGSGESCLFELGTASGLPASLQVQALAPASVEEAKRFYTTQRGTRMTPDGAVSGVGEEAEGFTIQTEPSPGFLYSEYRIQVRQGNLVIDVWLAVGDKKVIPKQTLAAKVLEILKASLATVDQAWRRGY